jgi:hypothetical protein
MLNVLVPMLVSVTVFEALVAPIAAVPNISVAGESFAVVPIPLSETCCGLPLALSVTFRTALRDPIALGLNVTLIVQLPTNALPQLFVWMKSPAFVPLIAMLLIVRVVVALVVKVTVLARLVVASA